ncbi:MAG TPA: hypothetical protein VFQ38_21835 [Longimicrobiales bacterium]|nr:hypothetical protein [Longimicrobiales bacterium]
MQEIIARRRRHRTDFMLRLYARTDASVAEFVSAFDIGEELGIEPAEVAKLVGYLEEKGWVMVDDHRSGLLRITAAGIDHVESLPPSEIGPGDPSPEGDAAG